MSTRSPTLALLASLAVVVWAGATAIGQTPPGYFDPPVYFPNGFWASFHGTATGDLDHDGRDDLVLAVGSYVEVFLSTAQGNIGAPTWFQVQGSGYVNLNYPVLADLNGDGTLDLVVEQIGTGHRMFLGDGMGGFSHGTILTYPANTAGRVLICDIDGDGHKEVVLNEYVNLPWSSVDTTLHPLVFNAGVYLPTARIHLGYDVYVPQFADLNGDGWPDVVGLARANGALFGVYIALGNGSLTSFGPPTVLPFPFAPTTGIGGLVTVDADRNGTDDLVISVADPLPSLWASSPPSVNLFVCLDPLGSASWSTFPAPGVLVVPFDPAPPVDVNGDGILDVIGIQTFNYMASNISPRSRIGIALGDGGGHFLPPQVLDIPGNFWFPNFGTGNFDGDEDPDLFVIDGSTAAIGLLRNQARYGLGCAGPGMVPPRLRTDLPVPGNGAFTLRLEGAMPFAPAVLGLSLAPAPTSAGCQVLIDFTSPNLIVPFGTFGITSTDATGAASIPLPIPNDPLLHGVPTYAQWGAVDPAAPAGVALTQGAKIVLW